MTGSLLDQFLEKGLLDLKGNDEWYQRIALTAEALAIYLRANPDQVIPFGYAALNADVDDNDPAIQKTLGILKEKWKTYASVSMEQPFVLLRAIIFDALLTNANTDHATKNALALLLGSALPHLKVGAEAEVWRSALDALVKEVEGKAEVAWSVPSEFSPPPFPQINVPTLRVVAKGGEVDEQALAQGLAAAAGPQNAQGQPTQGNKHWPNANQNWSTSFASLAAAAVSQAIGAALDGKAVSIKADAVVEALTVAISKYLKSVVAEISSRTHGVELRSRLLWWKEALVSHSAFVSYRDVAPKAAPGLMAYDYQALLPSLTPASVSAFFAESVRVIQPSDEAAPIVDWLRAIAASPHTVHFRTSLQKARFPDGRRPLVSLITSEEPSPFAINAHTVFPSDLSMRPTEIGLLLFLELQAIKAVREILPVEEKENANGETGKTQGEESG